MINADRSIGSTNSQNTEVNWILFQARLVLSYVLTFSLDIVFLIPAVRRVGARTTGLPVRTEEVNDFKNLIVIGVQNGKEEEELGSV